MKEKMFNAGEFLEEALTKELTDTEKTELLRLLNKLLKVHEDKEDEPD